MTSKIIGLLVALIILFFVLINCLFSINEGQSALLMRLGQIVSKNGKPEVYGPGLHGKIPFINSVNKFDMRLQNLDAESPRILTKEQKYLYVDYYAKWKIVNLPLFFTRTGGNIENTQNLLRQKINDGIRNEFGKRTLQDVISDDRLKIMQSLRDSANQGASSLGIQVIDVGIKSIDLLKQVLDSVYQRMSTKREQVATEYRAEGQAQSEKIQSAADAEAEKTIAEAKRESALTRSSGDGEAAAIYLQAYNQDPGFYSLYRSLEAYREVFTNKNTVMVLKTNSEFLRYFTHLPSAVNPPKAIQLPIDKGR